MELSIKNTKQITHPHVIDAYLPPKSTRIVDLKVHKIFYNTQDIRQWHVDFQVFLIDIHQVTHVIDHVLCYPVERNFTFASEDISASDNTGFRKFLDTFDSGHDGHVFLDAEPKTPLDNAIEIIRSTARIVWSSRMCNAQVIAVTSIHLNESDHFRIFADLKLRTLTGDVLLFKGVQFSEDPSNALAYPTFNSVGTFDDTKRFIRTFGATGRDDDLFERAIKTVISRIYNPLRKGYLQTYNPQKKKYEVSGIYFDFDQAIERLKALEMIGIRGMRVVTQCSLDSNIDQRVIHLGMPWFGD